MNDSASFIVEGVTEVNLWAWQDNDGLAHVGVSEGSDMGKVLDITMSNPKIRTIAELWEFCGSVETVIQQCTRWLREVPFRVSVLPSMVEVPVALEECWAAGVTYEMSRDARMEESEYAQDLYRRVYEDDRPELFFKAPGRRIVGTGKPMGLRRDSEWHVPEPELTVILDPTGEIFGYTVGNDLSSRDIEGRNPLYLPQAKIFHCSAALGPSVALAGTLNPADRSIAMTIVRGSGTLFQGVVPVSRMRRTVDELVGYLRREWPIEGWTALMTGTGLVPPSDVALKDGDIVTITIDGIGTLVNSMRRIGPDWASVPTY
ncbi:MAG: fumarylacetoacetate hydrolase family protein [Firmicutes bacterium]|nr:fumarylacetoacetate hydrolase family protein [Bacillota bacterium]